MGFGRGFGHNAMALKPEAVAFKLYERRSKRFASPYVRLKNFSTSIH